MKKVIKVLSYVLIAVFFSIALSGCTKKDDSSSTISNQIIVWSFEDDDVWVPIKKTFEKNYKGYELVYQKQAFNSDYESRVLNSILSGKGPDVWSMPNDWVYRHKDKLYPMADESAAGIDLAKDFVPSVKNSVYFDNKIYAMTPSSQPLMVYYNRDLFQATLDEFNSNHKGETNREARIKASNLLSNFPLTWSDFVETIKLITKKEGSSITLSGAAIGTESILNAQDILYLLMLQNETKIVSDDLQLAAFNLPIETPRETTNIPGQSALDFYTSFANPSSPNYTWDSSLGDSLDAFLNQKTAMVFGYSDFQLTLSQKLPSFHYSKAFAPQLSEDSSKIVDYAKFNAFGVSNLSQNPEASWGVIDTLVYENSNDFNSAMRLYSSFKSNSSEINFTERVSGNPEKLSLLTAKSLTKGRYPVDFDNQIKSMILSVNKGLSNSKSALDLAANNITEQLRRSDW